MRACVCHGIKPITDYVYPSTAVQAAAVLVLDPRMIMSKIHALTAEAEKSVSHPKRARRPAAYVGATRISMFFHPLSATPPRCHPIFVHVISNISSCCGFAIYTVMFLLSTPLQQQGRTILFEAQSHSLECGLNAR